MLLSLAAPMDKAKAQLDSLGIAVYDNEGNMRQLNDIMADLNVALGELSQEERTNALNDIFNKTDLNAVNAMLASTTGRFDELSASIEDSKGAATDMAETMESGLAGSMRSFESAMEGMKIEIGSIFSDIKKGAVQDAIEIVRTFTTNLQEAEGDWTKIAQAVGQLLTDIINSLAEILPEIVDLGMEIISMLGQALLDNLDVIVAAATDIVLTLLDGIVDSLPAMTEGALQLVVTLVEGILENLPKITEAAIETIATLATGLADTLPELIPVMIDAVITMCTTLLDNMDKILEAAFKLIEGLAKGIINSIPKLVEALPKIITAIVDFITKNLPKIVEMGVKLTVELAVGLVKAIPQLVKSIPQIITALLEAFGKAAISIVEVGKNIVKGLWDGIKGMGSWIKDKVKGFVDGIVGGVKGVLGIRSPSAVFAGIGENMAEGLGAGFEQTMNRVAEDIQNAVPTSVDVNANISDNVTSLGGMGGNPLVVVQQMIVRSEDDIRRISQELYNLMQTGSRAQGRFNPA